MTSPSKVQVTGPLLPFKKGFIKDLAEHGYAPLSAANQVRVLAHLSRWMEAKGITPDGLNRELTLDFLQARRHAGYVCWRSERGLAPLLSFLRSTGVVPDEVPPIVEGPVEQLLDAYRSYLVSERGLVLGTVIRCLSTARLFFTTCNSSRISPVENITGLHVRAFALNECLNRKVGAAQLFVSELRCLLRFLFVSGRIATDLSFVVPAVAGQRGNSLPKGLDQPLIVKLLASCDRRTNVGLRDFAILTLLARLGLRAGEAAALSLDDIDWHTGELTIVGKGNRRERLPIPVDVGDALAGHLRRRRQSEHRNVFLNVRAPHGAMTAGGINKLVHYACTRAGIPAIGPHRLRHSLATDMLSAGSTLVEVGQVLRHRSVSTTAIYAKVDVVGLRSLALPWPGAQ